MIRLFIGHDQVENVAFNVMANSVQRNSSQPVAIAQVELRQLTNVLKRERHPLQSNEFSFSRWLVPYLCEYKGWAIWADCDMLFMDDIADLWDLRDDDFAVQVVKHDHKPKETTKYLGTAQTAYEKKNWSSVMLFNCARCRALTPDYVNAASGLDLHQFKWIDEELIGEIPHEWNFLVGYDELTPDTIVKNAHFTIGGPYFSDYKDVPFSTQWWSEFDDMVYCKQLEAKQ